MFAMTLQNRAATITAGVLTTLISAAVLWLFSVGGVVTWEAYAADQDRLDEIVDLIRETGARQTYERRLSALDRVITDAEQRIEELRIYIETDPSSTLTTARQANVRRLQLIVAQAQRDKRALERQARLAGLDG